MYALHISLHAEEDIQEVLLWSLQKFGSAAQRRYQHLLYVALTSLARHPLPPGNIERPEFGKAIHTWHLRFSREKARTAEGVVQRPRHLLVYRIQENHLEILRLLHDSMELDRHLPHNQE